MSESRHQTKPQTSSLWIAKNPLANCPDEDAIARADQSSSDSMVSCSHVLPNACGESFRALRRTFRYSGQSSEVMGRTNSTEIPSEWGRDRFILSQLDR